MEEGLLNIDHFSFFLKEVLKCDCGVTKNQVEKGHLGGSVGWASSFSSGHDLTAHEFEPHVGLCADSSEPRACFGFCVSLSLCLCLSLSLSLSLSKIR